jgi:lysophospholipid acyltransferase (LPLAT)-like uncharacterized protein
VPADGGSDAGRATWIARAGTGFARALASTWRVRVSNAEGFRRVRAAGKPVIFVLWHGQMLPLLYQHRDEGVAVLISEHGDGEIIARIATGLGYETIRGSTSRSAARALLGLARVLNEGRDLAITPDGPRGPARSFAPGPLIVAQRTGAPIVAAVATASSAWRLKSWDRFMIPRPFARVTFAYSDPVYVAADNARDAATPEEAERMRLLLETTERHAHG